MAPLARDLATTDAFNEHVEDAIRKVLLDEYKYMKSSTINKIAHTGALAVSHSFRKSSETDNLIGVRRINFFDLPRELRDQIYAYAVVYTRTKSGSVLDVPIGPDRLQLRRHRIATDSTAGPRTVLQPAIACASKQLREEALPLFYNLNRFVVSLESLPRERIDYDRPGQALADWIKAIGRENFARVKHLTILSRRRARQQVPMTLDEFCSRYAVVVPSDIVTYSR